MLSFNDLTSLPSRQIRVLSRSLACSCFLSHTAHLANISLSDQSVVKMADVRRKTTMGSQSSMEDHNAKPGSASSAQRSTVVETTESVDRELDGKRETEGSVSVTSRSWEKISTPQISAVEDELQRCPALCDKAWPASSGDFSPGGSRVAVADGVPTVIIVNEEEEPHPSHCIADEESEIDLENARQEQQQNSTRGDLTIPGKHDKISRQSSSGIRLTYSTTPFVEGCRNMEVAPETRLRLRCARAAKNMQVEALRRDQNCDATALS